MRDTRQAPGTSGAEILAVIRSLPEAYRETLVLRLVEGMTGPEIARPDRAHTRLCSREPVPWNEASARATGRKREMSDYLWDRSGTADAEMLALEEKLSWYRFEPGPVSVRSGFWREHGAAIAAAVLLCAVASSLVPGIVHPRLSNWTVAGGGQAGSRVYIGRRIDVRSAPVALESDEIGRVELQPGANARVVESAPGRERFDLRQGRMHAFIWAPAGQFVVDTPALEPSTWVASTTSPSMRPETGSCRSRPGGWRFRSGTRSHSFPRARHAELPGPAGRACRSCRMRRRGSRRPFINGSRAATQAVSRRCCPRLGRRMHSRCGISCRACRRATGEPCSTASPNSSNWRPLLSAPVSWRWIVPHSTPAGTR